jgi:hypothetical protein
MVVLEIQAVRFLVEVVVEQEHQEVQPFLVVPQVMVVMEVHHLYQELQ